MINNQAKVTHNSQMLYRIELWLSNSLIYNSKHHWMQKVYIHWDPWRLHESLGRVNYLYIIQWIFRKQITSSQSKVEHKKVKSPAVVSSWTFEARRNEVNKSYWLRTRWEHKSLAVGLGQGLVRKQFKWSYYNVNKCRLFTAGILCRGSVRPENRQWSLHSWGPSHQRPR